ncbi:MAG TPA: hypothetical protein VGJ29_03790 [Vicinamibacterales bacterium]|jgi:hypothetical protein
MGDKNSQNVADEWVSFPGGELQGKRPNTHATHQIDPAHPTHQAGTLCFQCFRGSLDRDRALKAAGELDTATDGRFQFVLPLEPIDHARLSMLKGDRAVARAEARQGAGELVDRRRRAQIEARHVLQSVLAGVRLRQLPASLREHQIASATHAAELQLPEAWLPFVVSR